MEKPRELVCCSYDSVPSSEKSVLLVDDNIDLLESTKIFLELEGYKVSTASGGEDALIVLGKIEQPDLILLDMRMEDMSGPEFLTILGDRRTDILERVPIVFLTAMSEVPMSRAVGFIKKPFDIDNFLVSVSRFIAAGTNGKMHKH